MKPADTVRLVSLAAIWGASFLFMRIAAPSLGPVLTAELRTLIAGVALATYFALTGFDPLYRRWGRQYFRRWRKFRSKGPPEARPGGNRRSYHGFDRGGAWCGRPNPSS